MEERVYIRPSTSSFSISIVPLKRPPRTSTPPVLLLLLRVMGDLDSNNDGEVDFTEFIILVGALTVACNDFFLEFNEKQEKKK
ncbi:hypothetical protein CRUP_016407 [Coryphaenoides rupestris]|nr:hypothetical protein CRUP_016407 [Coryphaenoides rupestris]